jgi:putative ATPase
VSDTPGYRPLPEKVRPATIDGVLGQDHLVGPNSPLRQAIDADQLSSIILVGPPGSGKTTIARAIARHSEAVFIELSAVSSGKADVTKVIEAARKRRGETGQRTILFIDEIHRFNAVQQDALLGAIESGMIILIGATTENPGTAIRDALRSRCKVLRTKELGAEDMEKILRNAAERLGSPDFEEEALKRLAQSFRGDARSALMTLEEVHKHAALSGSTKVTNELIDSMPQEKRIFYDRDSQHHHAVVSAFIKSIRGSDPDAAIYYLATMLEGGEDITFIGRRLCVSAAEDIGMADPNALRIAEAALSIAKEIGMPEARLPLSTATIYLALAPKSDTTYLAIDRALQVVRDHGALPPPRHLTPLGKDSYINPHNSKEPQRYLPDRIKGGFYRPKPVGVEKKIYERYNPAPKEEGSS